MPQQDNPPPSDLQAAAISFGAGLHAARFHLDAVSIALRRGDCHAAVEALDKGQAAMLDVGTAYSEVIIGLAALLQATEGGGSCQ